MNERKNGRWGARQATMPDPKPRESAQQIAERIRKGVPPDPALISNINALREKEAKQ